MSEELYHNEEFDFESHTKEAVSKYIKVRPLYESFSIALKNILERCLLDKSIKFHSIEARAKEIRSFEKKVSIPSDEKLNRPKYLDPIREITDLSGIRIITFFPKTLGEVDKIILDELDVIERSDKSDLLSQEEKLGYQSIHYLVKFKPSRSNLSEYKRFSGMIAEIQLRTILQHTWAEIEHDIQYKSVTTIPIAIKRRFMALAGLLEIADREFQSIQDEDIDLRREARESVREGRLENVEITPDALKTYLDKKLGSDGRMTDFSYSHEANILVKIGFSNIKQVDDCIKNYDDNEISGILWGCRQGQLNRFEDLLLASMGGNFINRHPWSKIPGGFWTNIWNKKLSLLKEAGIPIGNFDV